VKEPHPRMTPSQPVLPSISRARDLLSEVQPAITFAIPSYNEGPGIVPTLQSLWSGMKALGLSEAPIFISDSSDDLRTVDAARSWADTAGASVELDHSNVRRSPKEALNVVLANVSTDLLVVTNADVLVPTPSLAALLRSLLEPPMPRVVVGVADADPRYRSWRHRAGAFQLHAVRRTVELHPPAIRAEGAFWGAWQEFYRTFRYAVGSGSITDDVELAREVTRRHIVSATSPEAIVYKVPPSSSRDFALQLLRWYRASDHGIAASSNELWLKLRVFGTQSIRDPLGSVLYSSYVAYAKARRHAFATCAETEYWEPSLSTKRSTAASQSGIHMNRPLPRSPRATIVTHGGLCPPKHGGAIRSVMTARYLADLGFDLHLLSVEGQSGRSEKPGAAEAGNDSWESERRVGALPEASEVTTVRVRSPFALGMRSLLHLRSVLCACDVVVVESALLLPAVLLAGPRRPLVWDTNVLETLHYRRLPTSPAVMAKGLFWYALERWSITRADVVVAISSVESRQWAQIFPRSKGKLMVADHAVPGGPSGSDCVDGDSASPESRPDDTVLFIANFHAKHNAAAAQWILEELAPKLVGRARLVMAGEGTDRLTSAPTNVELFGFVEDLSDLMARGAVCIAPLRSGAGVKTKVLDYARHGRRILATPVAMEGIEDCPGVTVATLEKFLDVLLQLLEHPEDPTQEAARRAAQARWYEEHCGDSHLAEQWAAIMTRIGFPTGGARATAST